MSVKREFSDRDDGLLNIGKQPKKKFRMSEESEPSDLYDDPLAIRKSGGAPYDKRELGQEDRTEQPSSDADRVETAATEIAQTETTDADRAENALTSTNEDEEDFEYHGPRYPGPIILTFDEARAILDNRDTPWELDQRFAKRGADGAWHILDGLVARAWELFSERGRVRISSVSTASNSTAREWNSDLPESSDDEESEEESDDEESKEESDDEDIAEGEED